MHSTIITPLSTFTVFRLFCSVSKHFMHSSNLVTSSIKPCKRKFVFSSLFEQSSPINYSSKPILISYSLILSYPSQNSTIVTSLLPLFKQCVAEIILHTHAVISGYKQFFARGALLLRRTKWWFAVSAFHYVKQNRL